MAAEWNFVLSPETGSQDSSGAFCRRWLPELARLPNKWLHTPWLAPPDVLAAAGVTLGTFKLRVGYDANDAKAGVIPAPEPAVATDAAPPAVAAGA